jgi:hypothetical protein
VAIVTIHIQLEPSTELCAILPILSSMVHPNNHLAPDRPIK